MSPPEDFTPAGIIATVRRLLQEASVPGDITPIAADIVAIAQTAARQFRVHEGAAEARQAAIIVALESATFALIRAGTGHRLPQYDPQATEDARRTARTIADAIEGELGEDGADAHEDAYTGALIALAQGKKVLEARKAGVEAALAFIAEQGNIPAKKFPSKPPAEGQTP